MDSSESEKLADHRESALITAGTGMSVILGNPWVEAWSGAFSSLSSLSSLLMTSAVALYSWLETWVIAPTLLTLGPPLLPPPLPQVLTLTLPAFTITCPPLSPSHLLLYPSSGVIVSVGFSICNVKDTPLKLWAQLHSYLCNESENVAVAHSLLALQQGESGYHIHETGQLITFGGDQFHAFLIIWW